MLSRLRAAGEPTDAGVTLLDLVVGMTLMSIVGALALNFFIDTTRQTTRVSEQGFDSGGAQVAMTQIVKTLQVADSPTSPGSAVGRFQTISPTEVSFYSDYSPSTRSGTAAASAPTLVDFKLVSGVLKESITPPGSNPTTSTNTLLTGVTNSSPFTYCSDATDPSVTCTQTTNPASVALVQVTLTVQVAPGGAPQTVQSGVAVDGALS